MDGDKSKPVVKEPISRVFYFVHALRFLGGSFGSMVTRKESHCHSRLRSLYHQVPQTVLHAHSRLSSAH